MEVHAAAAAGCSGALLQSAPFLCHAVAPEFSLLFSSMLMSSRHSACRIGIWRCSSCCRLFMCSAATCSHVAPCSAAAAQPLLSTSRIGDAFSWALCARLDICRLKTCLTCMPTWTHLCLTAKLTAKLSGQLSTSQGGSAHVDRLPCLQQAASHQGLASSELQEPFTLHV